MRRRGRTYSKCFSRLAFPASLLDLTTPHLLLKLTFADATVVLEREQDVERGQHLQLGIILPLRRVHHLLMGGTPPGEHVDVEALEESDDLGDAVGAGSTAFLLLWGRFGWGTRRNLIHHVPLPVA